VRLADLQARFYALVTAPESVAATLAAQGPAARQEVERLVAGDARLCAVDRLEIYAGMYFVRLRDVLAEEYPRTSGILGADAFHNLVTSYLDACRPGHPSLREAGARLPDFLAADPAGRDRPWLAELARLERTRLELFDGPDARPLAFDDLAGIAPADLGAFRLRSIPCAALLENRFAIATAWRTRHLPAAAAETLLVWRRDVEVFHRPVDAEEAGWLRRLAPDGLAFQALCAGLAAGRSDQAAAARAFELVGRWAADGLLRAAD